MCYDDFHYNIGCFDNESPYDNLGGLVPDSPWDIKVCMRIKLVLTHLGRMDFPILMNWMSPLSILGALGVFFHFYFRMSAKIIAPDGMLRFAASHLGLFCLHMSHKKDASLIWVN